MWTVLVACLFGVGPAIVWLSPRLVGGDGGPGWTYLLNHSPALGGVTLLVTLLVAFGVSAATARFLGVRAGLGAAGMTLIAPALQGGEIVEIVRWADAPGLWLRLAIEGALVAGVAFVGAVLLTRVAHRDDPMSPAERQERARSHLTEGAIGAACALGVGAVAGWVLAREPLKGQMLAAGFAAGVCGMGAARVIVPRAPIPAVVLGVMLLAVVGPALGLAIAGGDALRAVYEQRVPAIATPTPVDWLAGALLGMPIGLSWALSAIEKRTEKHGATAPA